MKLGLVARADNSGLGIQTHEFYLNMQPEKTLVVDISKLNNNPVFNERYNAGAIFVTGIPTPQQIDDFLEGLDCVFIAEAAYNPYLYTRAQEMGVKTAVQYNYEFMDWLVNDAFPKPDMLIAPSKWHFDDVQKWVDHQNSVNGFNIKHVYLHCPVNREKLPYREISRAYTFLHTAGRAAAHDRNGTKAVIAATRFLNFPAKVIVHFQGEQGLAHQVTDNFKNYLDYAEQFGDLDKLEIIQQEFVEYSDIYAMGDVMVLPRRYGGNCLPLNEALSVGMPVIMTDISPNNELLPKEWLIPSIMIDRFQPRTVVDIYSPDVQLLARKMDEFYYMNPNHMLEENRKADFIAETISWEHLKPIYKQELEALCTPN
jgi:glycosyltransferase involved in cell wall biosynthesis